MMKGGMAGLMKQAQQMQEKMQKMQEELANAEVTGQSGGGLVSVVMTGRHDVKRVSIDQSLMSTDADDKDGDGFVSVTEGAPFYGDIGASLTTEGDTSPDSGLAVDRFPTDGDESYSRTFEVSEDVAKAFEDGTAVLVLHGVDKDGSGTYDGDVMSDLDPSLPMEATAPAACGAFTAAQMGTAPEGGVGAGACSVA